jgi:hypothetical protein
MCPNSAKQRRKRKDECPYVVKPLRWNEERKKAWLHDVMRVIIDMYIEQHQLEPELPLFDMQKKSLK